MGTRKVDWLYESSQIQAHRPSDTSCSIPKPRVGWVAKLASWWVTVAEILEKWPKTVVTYIVWGMEMISSSHSYRLLPLVLALLLVLLLLCPTSSSWGLGRGNTTT